MAKHNELTHHQIEEICCVYEKCKNQLVTAKLLGHSSATVSKYLIANGHGCGHGGNQTQRKITDDEIIADIQAGYTRQEIADRHGVHVANLDRRMRNLGMYAKHAPNTGGISQKKYGECWHYVASQDERFSQLHPNFQYLETRKDENGTVRIRLKCKRCGSINERAEATVRGKNIKCEHCQQVEKEKKQMYEKRAELVRFLYALKELKTPKMCACCGKSFYSQYSLQAYCSDKCKRKAKKLRRKERNPESFRKAHNHAYRHIQRARKYGCAFEYGVTLKAVMKRDNGICKICGEPCDINDRTWGFAGPLYPSVDHIIPLCRQGPHTWENVQLAHMICNSEKRDLITV